MVQSDFLVKTGEGLSFTFRLTWGQTEAAHMHAEQKQRRSKGERQSGILRELQEFKSFPGIALGEGAIRLILSIARRLS